jgi:hypothetical protein
MTVGDAVGGDQSTLRREDDGDGLLAGVCGGLVRVSMAPCLDPGTVAKDGRQASASWAASKAASTAGAARSVVGSISAMMPFRDRRTPSASICSPDSPKWIADRSRRNVEPAAETARLIGGQLRVLKSFLSLAHRRLRWRRIDG